MDDHIDITFTSLSNKEVDDMSISHESIAPQCIPRRLWTSKCMILHRANAPLVAKRICRNVNSDVIIGSLDLLGNTHVAVRISSTLFVAEVPND